MHVAAVWFWIAAFAAGNPAGWKPSRPPTDQDRRLGAVAAEAAAHSVQVTRWDDLPAGLHEAFAAHSGIKGMSDAGGPFNPTDSGGPETPRVRLRYAMSAQGYWFVCYEVGGIARLDHVAIWTAQPPLWLHAALYRSAPSAGDIGPDLAAHFYVDER